MSIAFGIALSLCKTFVCLAVFILALGIGPEADGQGGGIVITTVVDDGREVRLLSEPGGEREDNNGGSPPGTSYIFGDNGNDIPNYSLYGFDLSPFAGTTITGDATVTITKNPSLAAGEAGSVGDIITLSELAITNSGWVEGTGSITFDDTPADEGSVSYLNRVQFVGSGVSEPWLDAGGNAVSNLTGAITPVASRPGYNFSEPSGTEYELIVPQATAQRWLDDGLAGLVFSATDPDPINGDGKSRFVIFEDVTIRFSALPVVLLGDVNRDAAVTFRDIAPFIALLATGDFQVEADTNQDGSISFHDISDFIAILFAR